MTDTFNVIHLNSRALREAAEILHRGLLEAGYDAILTGNTGWRIDPERRRIFLAARPGITFAARYRDRNWRELLREQDILFNSEQLSARALAGHGLTEIVREREVWDYSAKNVAFLRDYGCPDPRLVPLGGVDGLDRIHRAEPDADVMFYGLINPPRQAQLDAIAATGLRCRVHGPSNKVFGAERDALIGRSKLVVNIHFHRARIFEAFRVAYLLNNGICVVSERGPDPVEAHYEGAVVFCDDRYLAEACVRYASDDALRAEQERGARAWRQRFRMADVVRAALHGAPVQTVGAAPA